MIITCRGQRINGAAVAELIAALTIEPVSNVLKREGFTLKPVRAPKGLNNGRLTLRLTWTKTDGDCSFTVRQTVTLQQPRLVR